ncbi:hypothetical protein GCM10020367_07000 [Streptomyces sannanensis]|uniref:Uncharacterized protein n=1 Tax=Streptomyces sannanensis TaxID=285536 RepID=A0ABP6S5G7_9ACTN
MQRGQQVVVASRTGFDDRDPGGGVRDEDTEQTVPVHGGLLEEELAVTGQIGHRLGRSGGYMKDPGRETHPQILTQSFGDGPPMREGDHEARARTRWEDPGAGSCL